MEDDEILELSGVSVLPWVKPKRGGHNLILQKISWRGFLGKSPLLSHSQGKLTLAFCLIKIIKHSMIHVNPFLPSPQTVKAVMKRKYIQTHKLHAPQPVTLLGKKAVFHHQNP